MIDIPELIDQFVFAIMILGFITIFGVLLLAIVISTQYPEAKDQACENLGMEKVNFQGTTYCLDNNAEAHHTKFTCSGIFNVECTARIISLGNYRTTPTR